MKILGKKRWFTLIEMLIVIVIIWVLASALIPRLGSARGKANDVARKADLQQIATAIISRQIDTNSFPGDKEKIVASWWIALELIKWWMASIPVWDDTAFTWLDNVSSSWYIYYPMYKNGWEDNGFLLIARAETEWWANFVRCANDTTVMPNDWTKEIDDIVLCTEITLDTAWACDAAACKAKDKWELRYIYKY